VVAGGTVTARHTVIPGIGIDNIQCLESLGSTAGTLETANGTSVYMDMTVEWDA
jgi:hypothetical protein